MVFSLVALFFEFNQFFLPLMLAQLSAITVGAAYFFQLIVFGELYNSGGED